jgi:hypothetical protein
VQILLGHTKIESTVRYLGVDVEDALALALAEGTEVQRCDELLDLSVEELCAAVGSAKLRPCRSPVDRCRLSESRQSVPGV